MSVRYEITKNLNSAEEKLVEDQWRKADRLVHGKDYDAYEWLGEGCIVARETDEMVGFARLAYEGGVMWLEELLVFEGHRNKGIGNELLQRVIQEATAHNCHKITLETDYGREGALKLYEKFGFKVEFVMKNHYAHKDGLLMTKYL